MAICKNGKGGHGLSIVMLIICTSKDNSLYCQKVSLFTSSLTCQITHMLHCPQIGVLCTNNYIFLWRHHVLLFKSVILLSYKIIVSHCAFCC